MLKLIKGEQVGELINLARYRRKRNKARFYWRMMKGSYRELAMYASIDLDTAHRWELAFVKEREKELKDAKSRKP